MGHPSIYGIDSLAKMVKMVDPILYDMYPMNPMRNELGYEILSYIFLSITNYVFFKVTPTYINVNQAYGNGIHGQR